MGDFIGHMREQPYEGAGPLEVEENLGRLERVKQPSYKYN